MIRILLMMVVALLSSCSAQKASSDERETTALPPGEPPLKCEITRGAWCFMKSPYRLTFSHAQDEPYFIWMVSEEMWQGEAGVILEDDGCADHAADTIEVVGDLRQVQWRGQKWREVKVRLRKDGTCHLRLLAPTENAPLDMAASALSTHISACYAGEHCATNVIADIVYPFFRAKRN